MRVIADDCPDPFGQLVALNLCLASALSIRTALWQGQLPSQTARMERSKQEAAQPSKPVIILVEPQLGENIGMVARAMANFGLDELRLVNPRDGWPNDKARAAASKADHVIDARVVFADLESAVADLNFVLATTARERDGFKPVRAPVEAARALRARGAGAPAHRHPVRARAVRAVQRGDRARRRDRHLSGQSGLRLAQHRPGGAADVV